MSMPSYGSVNDAYMKMFNNKTVIKESREHLTEEEKDIAAMKDSLHLYGKVHDVISNLDDMLTNHSTNDNDYLERLHKFVKAMDGKISKQYDILYNKISNKAEDEGISAVTDDMIDNITIGGDPIPSSVIGTEEFENRVKEFVNIRRPQVTEYYSKSDFISNLRTEYPNLKQSQLKRLTDIIYN